MEEDSSRDATYVPSRKKLRRADEEGDWEVLMLVDSEAAARVSGAAETVDYFR